MTGVLTLNELKAEAEAGTIDTVIVAMTDMAGQLVGKRFHAHCFLDGGGVETHACLPTFWITNTIRCRIRLGQS
jgi:glutamine synthetase